MDQNLVNEKEWQNSDNWGNSGIYFSKKDSRNWVPKRNKIGYTLNLAKNAALAWLVAIIILIAIVPTIIFSIVLSTK